MSGEADHAPSRTQQEQHTLTRRRELERCESDSDKFKDECGVMAVHNHLEASTMAYLGLHQLQHRGQESAGVVSSNGERLFMHKAMGRGSGNLH